MIAEGRFPKPKRLGKRSVWTDQEIQQWREQWLGGSDG
nr:AlpA family phage regulatory protein [Roseovarius sp. A46]